MSSIQAYSLHPEALNDLDEIRAYIAEDSPDAADRMVTEIFDSIRALVSFPQQGYRRPNLTSLPASVQAGASICDRFRARKKAAVESAARIFRCFPGLLWLFSRIQMKLFVGKNAEKQNWEGL